jgi:membrane-associated phospholipid phosphatase
MSYNIFRNYIFIIIFFSLSINILAQKDTNQYSFNVPFLKTCVIDLRDAAISPYRWNKNQWIGAGIVLAGTAVLYSQDDFFYDVIQKNRNKSFDNLSKYFAERIGSGLYSLPAMGILYVYGSISSNQKEKQVALNAVKAFGIAGIIGLVPKNLLGRHRPYQDDPANPKIWDGPFKNYHSSFVSGHTIVSFAMFTVIADAYRDKPLISIMSYSMASLVGLSRMYDNKHWSSDVFAGAAMGYAIGKLVSHNNIINYEGSNHQNMVFIPTLNGFTLVYNFR